MRERCMARRGDTERRETYGKDRKKERVSVSERTRERGLNALGTARQQAVLHLLGLSLEPVILLFRTVFRPLNRRN